MIVHIADIPADCRNNRYIIKTYGVSRTSAWRLLSGRFDHICPGYHKATIITTRTGWYAVTQEDVMRLIRNCVAHQLYVWRISYQHLDDIAQECYINAYCKSGVWEDMPAPKKRAYLATLAKQTTNDYLKKYVHFTDMCKNDMLVYSKAI